MYRHARKAIQPAGLPQKMVDFIIIPMCAPLSNKRLPPFLSELFAGQTEHEKNISKISQALDLTMKHDDAQWRSHPSQLGAGPREEVSRATIRYRRPIRKQGNKKSRLMLYKNVINSAAVIPKFCGTPFQIRNPV